MTANLQPGPTASRSPSPAAQKASLAVTLAHFPLYAQMRRHRIDRGWLGSVSRQPGPVGPSRAGATAAGLNHVTGDAAVLMDADLQHPPELIRDLVENWRAGFDIEQIGRAHV